jgi:hypothetical protein
MTLNRTMVPATMLVLSLMGLHAGSHASTVTTQNGTDCKSYGWTSSGHAFTAVSTVSAPNWFGPVSIICPITRVGPGTSGGLRVWLDGAAPPGTEVSCTLWSYEYNGVLLASQSMKVPGAGTDLPFDRYLELAPAAVPTYSSQVITCALPTGGLIFDIEPISL